jgi:hypothetical protein
MGHDEHWTQQRDSICRYQEMEGNRCFGISSDNPFTYLSRHGFSPSSAIFRAPPGIFLRPKDPDRSVGLAMKM